MSDEEIGEICNYPISSQFKNEPEFSEYLSKNLHILSDVLNIDLSNIEGENEVPVGRYRCDDVAGEIVAIENKLGKSDHDHLGKLITYVSNLEVKVGVLICEDVSPEHIKAFQWLNERCEDDEDFYLLKMRMIKIESSKPAIDFSLIVGPKFKDIGRKRRKLRGESVWWQGLTDIGDKFRGLVPGVRLSRPRRTIRVILTRYGNIHFEWLIYIRARRIEVTFHIETKDSENNKKILNNLLPFKPELDGIMGEDVYFGDWSSKNTDWCKIAISHEFGENIDEEAKEWAAEKMARLYKFLNPKLSEAIETIRVEMK